MPMPMDSADVSQETLKKEIKEIVAGADLSTLTSKQVRLKLEDKLGVDLSSRKKEIDKLVMADVEDQASSHSEEEEEVEKEDDDEYQPAVKKARGPKGKPKKKKGSEDEDSDEEWSKARNKKPKPPPAGGQKRKGSAFTKSFKLSPELADVVGGDVMPRHEVVKKLWAVIKERDLQDPKNKQFAICDDQLLKVFGVKRFRTFGMMKHLKEHFLEAA